MRFGKQFFHYIIAEGMSKIVPLFLLPWIANNLSVESFGLFSLFQLYLTIGIIVVTLGTDQSLFRFVPENTDETEKKWFSTAVIFTFVIGILFSFVFFLMKWIFHFQLFDGNTLFSVQNLIIIIIIASINNQYFTYLKARQKSKTYIYFFLSRLILFYFIFILLIFLGYGQYSFIFAYYGAELFVLLTMTIIQIRYFLFPDMNGLKQMLQFGFPMFIITILGILIYQADHYMIKYFMGVSPVGEYGFSYKYAAAIGTLVLLINRVWLPRVYESGRDYLKKTLQPVMGFTLFFYLFIFLFIYSLFVFLNGRSVLPDIYDYIDIFPVLGMGYLVYVSLQQLDAFLLLEKRTWLLSGYYTFVFLLNISANLWAIPKFGLIGAAYTTLFSFLVLWGLLFFSFIKETEFKSVLYQYLVVFIIVIVTSIITVFFKIPMIIELLILLVVPLIIKKLGITIHYKKLIRFDIDNAIELRQK